MIADSEILARLSEWPGLGELVVQELAQQPGRTMQDLDTAVTDAVDEYTRRTGQLSCGERFVLRALDQNVWR
ncbi:hypothetical protein LCD36_04575 [Saccharopolyspora sp. 6T]|uniref:hypothetical protein n=1 Tax=Saccharopolyspora sp. 6T TaxID=2877238 RepID=UPI001CD5006C|nr:hypothetical protein [Saccharopolyspora sp. 6T]MCA1185727.1 hypothetical protein [Saccharopolyspora sp. 6T]